MPFKIIRQDITKLKVDAIVNAANTDLRMGGGVSGAIFKAANHPKLQEDCFKLAPIKTSEAVITDAYHLPSKYIIHVAGPVFKHWTLQQNEIYLRDSYLNCLNLAREHNLESIAFPLISSGIFGFPKERALKIATESIKEFLENYELEIYLVVFDSKAFELSQDLLGEVESFIDENLVYLDERRISNRQILMNEVSEELKFDLDKTFSQLLFKMIDDKKMNDVDVYKRANINRKLFSKIRSSDSYHPSKKTVIALALGLNLNLEETDKLLKSVGYALSNSLMFDVIIMYFIINEKYDVYEINEVLFKYDLPLLGE